MAKRTKEKKKINKKTETIILVILCLIIISVFSFFNINMFSRLKNRAQTSELRQEIVSIEETIEEPEEQNSAKIEKVKELKKENEDVIGYLEIPGTKISYPVVQGEDNSYYINHNYKKEKSKDGALFLDKDYDWNKPSENLLIYGHNNTGSKEMFVDLINYKDEKFYNEHKTINFTTEKEDAEYEIISVFLSRVYYQHEKDVFRYYFFVNASNKNEFDEYVRNAKKDSLYDIEETAKYGDQLITLSTCYYYTKDGRLAVVAKKK